MTFLPARSASESGPPGAAAVDDDRAGLQVIRPEIEGQFALGRAGQVGGDQLALAPLQHAAEMVEGRGGPDVEVHAEVIREGPDQFHFRPGRAVGADVVGAGAVARQHGQAAALQHLLELGGAVIARGQERQRQQRRQRRFQSP